MVGKHTKEKQKGQADNPGLHGKCPLRWCVCGKERVTNEEVRARIGQQVQDMDNTYI